MQLKKLFMFLVAATLMVTAMTLAVMADTEETFELGVTAETAAPISTSPMIIKPGEEVTVRISANKNTGVTFLSFTVDFDTTALEYVSHTQDSLMGGKIQVYEDDGYIKYTLIVNKADTSVGEMFEVTFRAKEDYCGKITISAELVNNNPNNCALTTDGFVKVPFTANNMDLSVHNIDTEQGIVTDPTCVTDGYTTYSCTNCSENEIIGNIVDALGHKDGEPIQENIVDADCITEGSYDSVTYCTVCGVETGRTLVVIPVSGHIPGEIVVENNVDPTCTAGGSYDNVMYCTICDAETSREHVSVPKLEHEWHQYEKLEPSCEAPGLAGYIQCLICGEYLFGAPTEIPAIGHKSGEIIAENNVDPDCINEGSYDAVVYCTVCGEEISRETILVDALGHKYEAVVTAPTCTEAGYTTYTCSVCGDTYVADEVKALGHDMVIDEAVAPDCENTGLTEGAHCSRCDEATIEQEVVEALGHKYEAVVTAPTCTEAGYTTYTCSVCGDTYVADEVIALGHTYGEWYTTKEPSEEEKGEKRRDCENCDAYETSPVAELGHSHDRWETITLAAVAPTCTEAGLTEGFKCSGCEEILVAQEVIPAFGHTEVIDAAVAPTCTETGLTEGKHCSVCNEVLVAQEVVEALGHTWDNACDSTCNVCDEQRSVTEHVYSDWVVVNEPTVDATGLQERKCTVCGHKDVQEIPMLEQHGPKAGMIIAWVAVSVTVLGSGGFVGYWFIIRKRLVG